MMQKFLQALLDKKMLSLKEYEALFSFWLQSWKFHQIKVAKPLSVFPMHDFPPKSMYVCNAIVHASTPAYMLRLWELHAGNSLKRGDESIQNVRKDHLPQRVRQEYGSKSIMS